MIPDFKYKHTADNKLQHICGRKKKSQPSQINPIQHKNRATQNFGIQPHNLHRHSIYMLTELMSPKICWSLKWYHTWNRLLVGLLKLPPPHPQKETLQGICLRNENIPLRQSAYPLCVHCTHSEARSRKCVCASAHMVLSICLQKRPWKILFCAPADCRFNLSAMQAAAALTITLRSGSVASEDRTLFSARYLHNPARRARRRKKQQGKRGGKLQFSHASQETRRGCFIA